ncbi:MAG TPA: thiamine-phosphate kinase [Acidobacteriota bacterium]|nr:thiamine-phosphate kinase [Acidobacteriota bacterium]HNT99179.1 thiamine-phosphate kinase [Acidobacteriota bacterium]HQO25553.1 thiamine-phosphate kinase [Acidobacteriota bacterium]HQP73694.1 thiamine-phosphate kinase [Acidobacteriota bacterium]
MKRLSEEALIRWIAAGGDDLPPFLRRGIGDDCAVCRPAPGTELVVTTDLLVEDRHFRLTTSPLADLGWKVGAANLSDIAAMGARPVAFFLSAAFPPDRQAEFKAIMSGLRAILRWASTPLAGGDLSAADRFLFCATVIGEAPAGGALLRSGARPGDMVYITGEPGHSAAGLRLLEAGWRVGARGGVRDAAGAPVPPRTPERRCLARHLRPEPRLAAGRFLRESAAITACIDTSDGIAKDLRQIAVMSGVGAVIDAAFVRECADGALVTVADVLGGGEDYELLFTVAPRRESALLSAYSRQAGLPSLRRVGRIVADHPGELRLLTPAGPRPLPVSGFDHFRPPQSP